MAGKPNIFNITDFRGGYFTNVPSALLRNNEMLQAENCHWNEGLEKRNGIGLYASVTGSAVVGGIRVYTNDTWHTILAVENSTSAGINFYQGSSDSFATITMASGSGYGFTTGKNVEFTVLGDKVVAVNGTDRPAAIIPTSSALYALDLEQYDVRERDNDNWYAGQHAGGTYADDTTDAQDAGGDDFSLASVSEGGFWTACDFTYSKLIFAGCTSFAITPSVNYEYFNASSTWVSLTTINQTPTWTSTGDHTLEFELPLSTDGTLRWTKGVSGLGLGANMVDRYPIRGVFTGLTDAGAADTIAVSHTHYLSQITGDQRPQAVTTHKDHVFIAAQNQVQIGKVNSIKGWSAERWEYFFEGGKEIVGMTTLNDYLVIMKPGMMFAIDGNSWQNWSTRTLTQGGLEGKRAFVVANNRLWHLGSDGMYIFDGRERKNVAKHIQSDLDGYTLTDACGVYYKGDVYMAFPTNQVALVFDPDTLRTDSEGDGRVSFFKWTSYDVEQFLYCNGGGDTNYLLALADGYVARGDYLNYDSLIASSSIVTVFRSKNFDLDEPQLDKIFDRAKPQIADVSNADGVLHTFKVFHSDTDGGQSSSEVLEAGIGTGFHEQTVSVPYDRGGKTIGFGLTHGSLYKSKLFMVAVDWRRRKY